MPKLKKRLPESRSEKRERLASEKELRTRDKELARIRRAQEWDGARQRSMMLREWRTAVDKRLESEEAYAHFEAIHARDWNLIRPYWVPNVEVSLAIQRIADGREADPEPILEWLETSPPNPALALHLLKRARFTPRQRTRLQVLVLGTLAQPERVHRFRYWLRLGRKLYTPEFRAQVAALLPDTRARMLLTHLDQERTMTP